MTILVRSGAAPRISERFRVAWESQRRAAPGMKLIVVDRAKLHTFQRLAGQFADARNVRVVLDRRLRQIRHRQEGHVPERRRAERRRLNKPWQGRDYIVVHVARAPSEPPRP